MSTTQASPFTSDPNIAPGPAGDGFDGAEERAPKKRGKLVAIILLLALAAGGGYYWTQMRAAGEGPEAPKPGEVLALESIQVNLAEGHYLKVGIALEFVEGAAEPDGSRALNEIIETFSGADMADILDDQAREKARLVLLKQINEVYDGDVYDVFYTDFVAQ